VHLLALADSLAVAQAQEEGGETEKSETANHCVEAALPSCRMRGRGVLWKIRDSGGCISWGEDMHIYASSHPPSPPPRDPR
jgi:hypothetical protein